MASLLSARLSALVSHGYFDKRVESLQSRTESTTCFALNYKVHCTKMSQTVTIIRLCVCVVSSMRKVKTEESGFGVFFFNYNLP